MYRHDLFLSYRQGVRVTLLHYINKSNLLKKISLKCNTHELLFIWLGYILFLYGWDMYFYIQVRYVLFLCWLDMHFIYVWGMFSCIFQVDWQIKYRFHYNLIITVTSIFWFSHKFFKFFEFSCRCETTFDGEITRRSRCNTSTSQLYVSSYCRRVRKYASKNILPIL